MVIYGKVLDVTDYIDRHPGGWRVMVRRSGKDCTRDFEALYHSPRARAMLDKYQIGVLAPGPGAEMKDLMGPPGAPRRRPQIPEADPQKSRQKRSSGFVGVVQLGSVHELERSSHKNPNFPLRGSARRGRAPPAPSFEQGDEKKQEDVEE